MYRYCRKIIRFLSGPAVGAAYTVARHFYIFFILVFFIFVAVFISTVIEVYQPVLAGFGGTTPYSLPVWLGTFVPFALETSGLTFCAVILLVGLLTQVYGLTYLRYDRRVAVFNGLLALFIFSMMLLVLSNSFILFFIGWELIG